MRLDMSKCRYPSCTCNVNGSILKSCKKMIGELKNPTPSGEAMGEASDGSSADYYKLPVGATQLQDLISYKDMNAQIGEIFRACFRYGEVSHSPKLRDLKKMRFYIDAEIKRIETNTEAKAETKEEKEGEQT